MKMVVVLVAHNLDDIQILVLVSNPSYLVDNVLYMYQHCHRPAGNMEDVALYSDC